MYSTRKNRVMVGSTVMPDALRNIALSHWTVWKHNNGDIPFLILRRDREETIILLLLTRFLVV